MTIGIYAIRNKIDHKIYIGKSKNIEHRFWCHRNNLSKTDRNRKQTNRYLWNAVQKYGLDNFEFFILESINVVDEEFLSDRELYYIDLFRSTESEFGYNLRRDSSTNMIVHDDTRKLISELNRGSSNPNYGKRWTPEMRQRMSEQKKEWSSLNPCTDERRKEISDFATELWKDEEKKFNMARKVAKAKSLLRFYQYDKNTLELIKVWENMDDILQANPDYHRIAIYSVCNGHKKSYRGYVWKSEIKE